MPSSAGGRIESLTGLRILAAGGVFLSHLAPPSELPDTVKTFMASGYNGVTLFFVLSGFVLAWNYTERFVPFTWRELWAFGVARLGRIYPLYLFALAIFIAPQIASGRIDQLALIHALALQPWSSHVERAYAFNAPGWSIGVEFFLYACFPLLILALARVRRSTVLLLVIGATAIVAIFLITWWFVSTGRADLLSSDAQSAHRWLYRNPALRLGDFVVGIVAALIVQNTTAPAWLARCAQLVGVVSVVWMMASASLLATAWSWDAAYIVPFALLLWGLAAGPQTRFSRLLGSPKMVVAGEASFAFYLLHWPLLGVVELPAESWFGWLVAAAVLFSVILLTALGAHRVIERPAQRWVCRVLGPKTRSASSGPEAVEALGAASEPEPPIQR